MTSEDRDNLLLYAAGALDADEGAALRQRLASASPQDLGALAEAEALLAQLPLALEEQAPSAGAKDRLLKSLPPQSLSMKSNAAPAAGESVWKRAAWMAIAASLVIFVVSLVLIIGANRKARDQDIAANSWAAELAKAQLAMAAQSAQLQQAEAELNRTRDQLATVQAQQQVTMVGLASPEATAKAHGRIMWDKQHNQWVVIVANLQPPAGGREYELWFITADEKKIPSKVFNTDANGNAMVMVDLPPGLKDVALAAITDEPRGGSDVPTGSIHLVGKVSQ